jgi:hypothetical protein
MRRRSGVRSGALILRPKGADRSRLMMRRGTEPFVSASRLRDRRTDSRFQHDHDVQVSSQCAVHSPVQPVVIGHTRPVGPLQSQLPDLPPATLASVDGRRLRMVSDESDNLLGSLDFFIIAIYEQSLFDVN